MCEEQASSRKTAPFIETNIDRCKGCELCINMCPRKCIDMGDIINSNGYYTAVFSRPQDCTGCAICAETCPDTAIEVWR